MGRASTVRPTARNSSASPTDFVSRAASALTRPWALALLWAVVLGPHGAIRVQAPSYLQRLQSFLHCRTIVSARIKRLCRQIQRTRAFAGVGDSLYQHLESSTDVRAVFRTAHQAWSACRLLDMDRFFAGILCVGVCFAIDYRNVARSPANAPAMRVDVFAFSPSLSPIWRPTGLRS